MSMSTHIVGFKPPDETFKKYKAVYEACRNAKIDVPDEINKYFDYQDPDDEGIEVDLEEIAYEWSDSGRAGLEISIADLPPGVQTIRFYNSW